jgi:uncharacterized protein YfaS (alpha-2-macroglobulin family)/TolA-binding protein
MRLWRGENRRRATYALVLLALAGAAGWRWAGPAVAQEARAVLDAADRSFREKSYAAALRGYRQALASGANLGTRRVEAEYRVAVSLGKSEQWDEALREGEAFAARYPSGIWSARGHYWLGRLYLAVPHAGYRLGERIYRGDDVPRAEAVGAQAGAAPERVWLQEEDRRKAREHLETARIRFQALRGKEHAAARVEEIDLCFDLARVLQTEPLWKKALEWEGLGGVNAPIWRIDPKAMYDPKWPLVKRILTLYAQIDRLADRDRHKAALAGLARALFLGNYQAQMAQMARRWDAKTRQWVAVPYPYANLKEEPALRDILARFPRDPIAPQVALRIGALREGTQDFTGALAVYESLLRRWPESKWVSDARARTHGITRRQLSLSGTGPKLPGKPVHVQLWARNLDEVRFTAYRIRLEELLARRGDSLPPHRSLAGFDMLFDGGRDYGTPVARWQLALPKSRGHQTVSETVETPLKEVGAYVVEASGPAIRAATLVLVTDLAVVSRTSREGLLGFVADAQSGKPEPDARVLVRETYYENGTQVAVARPAVDEDGTFHAPRTVRPGSSSHQYASLAWVGDRYAVSNDLWSNWSSDGRQRFQVYSYTDRSVYRPNQTVQYRILVAERRGGELEPAKSRALHVRVTDPRGSVVHERDVTSSEFGSAEGKFDLGDVPPLGEYYIQVTLPGTHVSLHEAGGNRFRVEEYKKPEYQVTVASDREQARVGEPVTAVVRARYYFGAPVANAKVVYKVFRTPFWASYRFPRPFDWLYRYWNEGDYAPSRAGGDLVAQGEGKTDAAGELRVRFETKASDARWQQQDARYTVEAEVTDASRRVITGNGEVKATHRAFYAFLNLPQEFFQAGDRVPVEVATRDASDRPVAAKGRLRVYRQLGERHEPVREELVFDQPLATDAEGRGKLTWESDAAGQYRIAFEAVDAWDQVVMVSRETWIAGAGLGRGVRLQGVRLLLDRDHYAEGETARVLVLTDRPDSTVLVTHDAGDSLLSRQVLRIAERSQVMTIPIARGHAPNFHVSATMIRDGQVWQTEHEILVPPVRQLLNVTLASDRERYHPGEKATFRLRATDWRGRPARAELSVGVVDAALSYIQKSYAPDLRVFSYGDRRAHSIPMTASLQVGLESRVDDSQPTPKFRVHEWTLPDGMGQLPDWPGFGGDRYYLGNTNLFFRGEGNLAAGQRFRDERLGRMAGGFGGAALHEELAVDAAAPAGAPAQPTTSSRGDRANEARKSLAKEGKSQQAGAADAPVRTNFADTAFWTPAVVTDGDGVATVTVTWPDNLTTWQATTRGWTAGAQVGQAQAEAVTYKDLIVRLQAPRFFVERDLIVLSGIVHNAHKAAKQVTVRLALDGDNLALADPASMGGVRLVADAAPRPEATVTVPAGGETRVDWVVRVRKEGAVKIRVSARSDRDTDAMELSFPVLVHGIEKLIVKNGSMLGREGRGARTDVVTVEVPRERKPGSSELVVQLTPSMAATMLDALPYLADYPYGCVEQTMSRFLPSVVTARTLSGLGIDLEVLGRRAKALAERAETGGRESRPVKNSPYTYPKGKPGVMQTEALAKGLHHRAKNPVFDSARLREMVRDGLQRLLRFQHGDGGWGWWQHDKSDPFMTAYVLYGLHTAKAAGEEVPGEVLRRGFQFLKPYFLESDDFESMAYYGYVLSLDQESRAAIRPLLTGRLYERRERLSAYAKSLLALALHGVGAAQQSGVLLDNLETTAKVDETNGTVHWAAIDRFWWRWYNNDVETNAIALRAMAQLRPESRLTPMLVRWLVNNRRGSTWRSTRDTAMVVYALADYVRATRELAPEYTVTVDLEGRVRRQFTVTAENALLFDNRFVVPDELLTDGAQRITIKKEGPGNLYYSAFLKTFSLEENIAAVGHEIGVRRKHFKLIPEVTPVADAPVPGKPLPLGKRGIAPPSGEVEGDGSVRLTYRRVPIEPGTPLKSGDLVETELYLEAANEYEYLVFEDLKPAGCEPVELRSGYTYGDGLCANMELRDQKVAFFISHLPQGTRRITYRLRAEIPGAFHVLPTNAYAMYAPDVRAISDEAHFAVQDLPESSRQARQ